MILKKVYGGDVFYILECSIFFVESLHWFENQEFLFINPVDAQEFVIAGREKEYSLYWAKDTFQTNLASFNTLQWQTVTSKVHFPLT